jgi:hypothetical protein
MDEHAHDGANVAAVSQPIPLNRAEQLMIA